MKTYQAEQTVNRGFYVGPWLDLQHVSADGEALPGTRGTSYVRIPALLALAVSPIVGGIFVLAFPLMVLGAVLIAITQPVLLAGRRACVGVAPLLRSRYQPVTAYLSEPRAEDAEPETDDELDELRAEVADRKADEDQARK